MIKNVYTDVTWASRAARCAFRGEQERRVTIPDGTLTTPAKKKRRRAGSRRRDAGSIRPKSRDTDILRFGAEQTFVRFDTAGEYLAPDYAPALKEPPPEQLDDLTPSAKRAWPRDLRHRLMAVSRLMRKLEQRGYVEVLQPWADQPAWYRVTTQGLRSLGLEWEEIPFPEKYEDLEARLRHDRYFTSHNHVINQVRLLLARGGANLPKKHDWRGERVIEAALPPREQGKRRPHKADGLVYLKEDGSWPILSADRSHTVGTVEMRATQLIGIEAECTQKSDHRLEEILPDLLAHHDFVWYFCWSATIRKAVADARKTLATEEERRRMRVLLLEEYLPCP